MKMTTIIASFALASSLFCGSCSEESPVTNPRQDETAIEKQYGFAKGADVSWLTQMEAEGRKFYTPEKIGKRWSVCRSCEITVV